jgi:hypothetical protein
MQRGHHALMALVSTDLNVSTEKHVKGRFMDERDDALACRFFYYGHLIGNRYDLCLARLSKEFYLSELVIGQRLLKRQEFIKQLRIDGTTRRRLHKRYPHLNWN